MEYVRAQNYDADLVKQKIMGPNPLKLEEELLQDHKIKRGSVVMDLGSGQGITSVFMVKEYGFQVYATDLWSDPAENQKFFSEMGLTEREIIAVKGDAACLPFEPQFFDAIVSVDSYNFFGMDPHFLDEKLLPFVKKGGYVYVVLPGMKQDCHQNLPQELLLSWTPEQLNYVRDLTYWKSIVSQCKDGQLLSIYEMESNEECWEDWLQCDDPYAQSDRKAIEAGACKYLNFIAFVLQKR